ncbi:MAG: TfoX/Sxy family protein [Chitinophagaceae bacterium]
MPFNEKLAAKVRAAMQLQKVVEEKKMFRGLTFMLNNKMCISVSGDKLMCRFDPVLQDTVAKKQGYEPMVMKGKTYKGFCYVNETGFKTTAALHYWIQLCIAFNSKAKASKKKKKATPGAGT